MTMLSGKTAASKVYWKRQIPIDYLDTSLTINTFENVSADLSGGKPTRLWYIIVEQTNNGATAEDIVLEITINGTAYTITLSNAASGTPYYIYCNFVLATGDFSFTYSSGTLSVGEHISTAKAVPFCCDSVGLIRAKQTTTVDGTSAQIEVNIVWDKLVGV